MFFLNFTAFEFLALFGIPAAAVTVMYLLDRSRRRRVVASLQFWNAAKRPTDAPRRRRIRQPWSLVMQLLALAMLIAAAGALNLGSPDSASRDHVLIVDASAWMGASSGNGTLIDQARRQAIGWLNALPDGDRVMVVRAAALATPVTGFISEKPALEKAIRGIQPGAAALALGDALQFAARAQRLGSNRPGEIVYAGAGRTPENDPVWQMQPPGNLRVLSTSSAGDNVSLRSVGLRHSETDPDLWQVHVAVHNDGAPRRVEVAMSLAGAPVAGTILDMNGDETRNTTLALHTGGAGALEVRLFVNDAFAGDNRATLDIPARHSLPVIVYSSNPERLRALVTASPFVEATFLSPDQYTPPEPGTVVVLDQFHPTNPPSGAVIWIEPPEQTSPVPVREVVNSVSITRWRATHPLTEGLDETQDLKLDRAEILQTGDGWQEVASVAQGPVIVARGAAGARQAVVGFEPGQTGLRYALAAPLLFANLLRWNDPELFHQWELRAGSVGSADVALDKGTPPDSVVVTNSDGKPLPATIDNDRLRFFSGVPGVLHISAGDQEMLYSMTLPDVPTTAWQAPASALHGVPPVLLRGASFHSLWRWLAICAALILAFEWFRYGRRRMRPAHASSSGHQAAAPRTTGLGIGGAA